MSSRTIGVTIPRVLVLLGQGMYRNGRNVSLKKLRGGKAYGSVGAA
jgi:hypothetical protein